MYFTKSRLREDRIYNYTADNAINEDRNRTSFDIFLSHSYKDKIYIYKLKRVLENYGYSVYVDWLVDGDKISRSNVTKETAELIRRRMKQSNCLIYATSDNSPDSKWIPWELGYFDGKNSKVAILPITENANDSFNGQEYLGLYPYITEEKIKGKDRNTLWINETKDKYVSIDSWIRDNKKPYIHS